MMMKRCFSLFVILALLLGLLPGAALGADNQTQPDPAEETAVQVSDLPAEEPVVVTEPFLPEEEPVELLASGNASVSGTVSLPGGASALMESVLYVYLCTPPVLDADGQVLTEPVTVKSTRVIFAQGQSSGSYTISGVAAGQYILRVYSYISCGSALGGDCYFNADGTPAGNPYAATVLNVGSGTNVNLTLPAASRSISGTLVFDTPAAADTDFRLYCYDDTTFTSYSSATTLKAGSKTASFSIGVEPGQYPIQVSNMEAGGYAYYDIYGNATKDYQSRMMVSTLDGSVSGLEINCTGLMGNVQSDEVEVTVQLPAALTEDKQYEVYLADAEGRFNESSSIYVSAGERSFTLWFSAEEGERFRVAYCDVTDCTQYYSPPTGARYATEDGITTKVSQAKIFTGGADTSITITEPACYTITGTLSREGNVLPPQAAYVLADFADGETYAGRVVYAYGEASGQYTIYVPQSQQGKSFQLTAARAMSNMGNQVDENTVTTGGSGTLSGNTQADLVLPAQSITIEGTLSLPDGMVAPEDGLVISLGVNEDYRNTEYATYYLPEGERSLHYALCAPVSGSTVVFAEISGKVERISRQAGGTFSQNQLMAADMVFPETVTISGTVSVPESCLDGVALVRLYINGTLNGSRVYSNQDIAVPAGKLSASYSITLPKGMVITQGQLNVEADTLDLLDTSYRYLQNDLKSFSSQYTNLSATLSSDLNLDIQLTQGVFLSGTLSLAEGLSAGTYSGRIELEPVSDGVFYSESFNFTGSSYDYKFSLAEAAMGQKYYVSIYLYEGEGVIPRKNYYYVADGVPTTDRGSATPITLGESGAVVDLTIPKARTISGSLASDDGGKVVWDPEEDLWLYLEADNFSESFRISPDAEGNWSATVDPSITGEFTVRTYVYGNVQTNIFGNRYYYYSTTGNAVTDEAEAGLLTIGAEDITDLKLYVETGWLLSGTISLPEGGTITGGTVDMSVSIKNADGSYTNYSGNGTVGQNGGSYSVAVPKEAAEYEVVLNSVYSLPSGVSSNLYFGDEQTLETGLVTGDTSGLDFTLAKAKTVITGTVYRPEGFTDYLSMNVYAVVEREYYTDSYSANVFLSNNEDSADFSIAIPATETAEEYQLYYNIYNNTTGILSGRNVYLCADGSLTTDSSLAGNFSLEQSPIHTFTPLTVQPFVAGKIYCPEGLTEPVTITVDYVLVDGVSTLDHTFTAVDVLVGPNVGQQDEDGRWYSLYSLGDADACRGLSYKLNYYSYNISDAIDTNLHYINADGSVVGADEAQIYTVPTYGSSVNVVNFTPILWDDGSEDFVLQSNHGFTNIPEPITYTYTYPGATGLEVTFSDRTDIDLTVNGRSYDAYSLAGQTITVTGTDTLTVEVGTVSYFNVYRFGFAVEKVEPVGVTAPETGAAAVYTDSGSTAQDILSGVKSGQPVRVTLVGEDTYVESSLMGAIYDKDGILLDIVRVPVIFTDGGCTASLNFEEYGEAVTLKLFLMDKDWAPEMANRTFTAE